MTDYEYNYRLGKHNKEHFSNLNSIDCCDEEVRSANIFFCRDHPCEKFGDECEGVTDPSLRRMLNCTDKFSDLRGENIDQDYSYLTEVLNTHDYPPYNENFENNCSKPKHLMTFEEMSKCEWFTNVCDKPQSQLTQEEINKCRTARPSFSEGFSNINCNVPIENMTKEEIKLCKENFIDFSGFMANAYQQRECNNLTDCKEKCEGGNQDACDIVNIYEGTDQFENQKIKDQFASEKQSRHVSNYIFNTETSEKFVDGPRRINSGRNVPSRLLGTTSIIQGLDKKKLKMPTLAVKENFGNEKKKEHFVAMEGPKGTRPQGGRVNVTELKIPDILRPYQKDNLIPKRSVGTLTRNVVKFGKK